MICGAAAPVLAVLLPTPLELHTVRAASALTHSARLLLLAPLRCQCVDPLTRPGRPGTRVWPSHRVAQWQRRRQCHVARSQNSDAMADNFCQPPHCTARGRARRSWQMPAPSHSLQTHSQMALAAIATALPPHCHGATQSPSATAAVAPRHRSATSHPTWHARKNSDAMAGNCFSFFPRSQVYHGVLQLFCARVTRALRNSWRVY